jgi:hypothetical protein
MAARKKNPKSPQAKAGKTAEKTTPPAVVATKDKAGAKPLSAVAAAARVLAETGQPMSCPELIAAMAEKGYWTSPAGKTPAATLYAALAREIKLKKDQARFRKSGRGTFSLA